MKKNPSLFFIILFSLLLLNSQSLFSQDFNLYNPSNEMFLFSAYDEGANAFRYNPAALGLKHKFNGTLNLFVNSYNGHTDINEGDIALNPGILGISYRRASLNSSSSSDYNEYLNVFSLGLGFGNKTFDGGFLLEWTGDDKESYGNVFTNDGSRFSLGLGFLYRPSAFISTAFVYNNKKSITPEYTVSNKYNFGLAVRPLKKDILSLMADFGFIPYSNSGFFEHYALKIGADFKAAKGFHIRANYTRLNDISAQDFINIGFRFDLPNGSVGYNNSFNKFNDNSNSLTAYKTLGSNLSFSFNMEKRESVVREKKRVLEITLSGSLQDYNTTEVFFGAFGEGNRSIHEVIADIDYAAKDNSIKGILLKIYPVSSSRFAEISAAIEELAAAMERFKATGKHITAYFPEDAGPPEYYLATYADDIVLPEEAMLFYGLSIDVFNYKQFLQKYGIELQNFYAGKYKLTFQGLLDSTSNEGKEVINRALDIAYDKMLDRVRKGRNIPVDDYMKMKLSQPLSGMEAKRLGLVDANGWYEDAKNLAERNSKTSQVTENLNRTLWDNVWGEPKEIAVVGIYGSITTGESEAPSPFQLPIPFLSGGRSTGSETVVRQLEDAFSNPKVRAVVLRVSSGGGSALASAEINDAIVRLKNKYKKPFVVSMGDAAASGGYYVSVSGDKIFCDELTVTGSIGVFTSRPNIDSLLKEQKLKVETFKRGENSDIGTLYRKLDTQEIEIIQGLIDYYYDRFIEAITKGRHLTKEEVEQVAQGRVWLGTDAFNKRLVDEIGGLYDALNYAKKQSGLGKRYKITYYAVPGGNSMDDLVTGSIMKYFQKNLLDLFGFGEDQDIEIK
jgi:protease-4